MLLLYIHIILCSYTHIYNVMNTGYHLGVGFNFMFRNYDVRPEIIGLDGHRSAMMVALALHVEQNPVIQLTNCSFASNMRVS